MATVGGGLMALGVLVGSIVSGVHLSQSSLSDDALYLMSVFLLSFGISSGNLGITGAFMMGLDRDREPVVELTAQE